MPYQEIRKMIHNDKSPEMNQFHDIFNKNMRKNNKSPASVLFVLLATCGAILSIACIAKFVWWLHNDL